MQLKHKPSKATYQCRKRNVLYVTRSDLMEKKGLEVPSDIVFSQMLLLLETFPGWMVEILSRPGNVPKHQTQYTVFSSLNNMNNSPYRCVPSSLRIPRNHHRRYLITSHVGNRPQFTYTAVFSVFALRLFMHMIGYLQYSYQYMSDIQLYTVQLAKLSTLPLQSNKYYVFVVSQKLKRDTSRFNTCISKQRVQLKPAQIYAEKENAKKTLKLAQIDC